MSTDNAGKSNTKKTKKDGTPRKPRAPRTKVDMSVASTLDFGAALQEMGGTPTWISSAGSMEDASTWKPTEKGQSLVGIHAGVLEQGVNQRYYRVAVADTSQEKGYRIETTKAGMGNKRLGNIAPGKPVRIEYLGVETTEPNKDDGKTRQYQNFAVFQTAR